MGSSNVLEHAAPVSLVPKSDDPCFALFAQSTFVAEFCSALAHAAVVDFARFSTVVILKGHSIVQRLVAVFDPLCARLHKYKLSIDNKPQTAKAFSTETPFYTRICQNRMVTSP